MRQTQPVRRARFRNRILAAICGIIPIVTGCATVPLDYRLVDNWDGIDKREAVALAAVFTERNFPEKALSHDLQRTEIRRTRRGWNVFFYPKRNTDRKWYAWDDYSPWRVVVDSVSGEIVDAVVTDGLDKY